MGGGGPDTTTSTTTQDIPEWMKPAAQQYLQTMQGLTMPGGQAPTMPGGLNQQVAPFSQAQQTGIEQAIARATGAQPLQAGAEQMAIDTMGGRYLSPESNPYLKDTYDQAARAMVDQYQTAVVPGMDAAALRAGAFGGSAAATAADQARYGLGRNLSELATDIYGQNYQAERQRQVNEQAYVPSLTANAYAPAQQLLTVGGLEQQLARTGLDTAFQNAMRSDQYPLQRLQQFGSALDAARGGAGTSVTVAPNAAQGMKG